MRFLRARRMRFPHTRWVKFRHTPVRWAAFRLGGPTVRWVGFRRAAGAVVADLEDDRLVVAAA
ncbi:MAG TPA: hypothetical protein VFX88_04330, partial [Actinomycetota bacterium]|nr:hypothetical protein [Actinomycetota bacterium]